MDTGDVNRAFRPARSLPLPILTGFAPGRRLLTVSQTTAGTPAGITATEHASND